MDRQYFITEVFGEAPYGGNQLATVVDVEGLSGAEMQRIARAFNFAETTFLTGGSDASGFDVRIFTPTEELPFAGHPTLGTAFLLRDVLKLAAGPVVRLNLGVGQIPVTSDSGLLWMRQNEPTFNGEIPRAVAAAALGLEEDEVDDAFPCQRVSTGLEFLLVPLISSAALKKARLVDPSFADICFLFCRGGYNEHQQVQARMFAGALGVPEDPATGSANGCLAAYLVEHTYFGADEVTVAVGQGYEVGRPSQLHLRASRGVGGFVIEVGGRVRLVADGRWHL